MKMYYIAIILAVISALSDALETPFSSLLLPHSSPIMTGSLLFLGAGVGIGIFMAFTHKKTITPQSHIRKCDVPTLLFVVIGDLIGIIVFMIGLKISSASSASLLQNFIIVTTAFIALIFFKEKIPKRLWAAILLITLGSITISIGDVSSFVFSPGLLLILVYCLTVGITTNIRQKITDRNPYEITIIRGLAIGICGMITAFIFGEHLPDLSIILWTMLLGLFSYGISSICLLTSQRHLGTTMSTTIFGLYPIISAIISLILFHQTPSLSFAIALLLLIPGFYMVVTKNKIDEPENHPIQKEEKTNSIYDLNRSLRLSNYLVAFGFTIVAALVILRGINQFEYLETMDIQVVNGISNLEFCCGVFLMLIASILVIIQKRGFSAISFMFFGMICVFTGLISDTNFYFVYIAGFEFLLAMIFLFSKSHKRIIYFLLFLLAGVFNLLLVIEYPHNEIITPIITFIFAAYLLYLAFISAGIKEHLPFSKLLMREETVNFKKSGSMMFYLIFAYTVFPWVFVYMSDNILTEEFLQIKLVTLLGAIFLALIAFLLMIIRSSGFTCFIFLSTSFILALLSQLSGPYIYVIGILFFLLGLYSAIRPKSRLLMSLLYFLYGITAFASITIYGSIELQFIQVLLNFIPVLISIYLAFAIFSTRVKFPLF